jgi:hypothetical protein
MTLFSVLVLRRVWDREARYEVFADASCGYLRRKEECDEGPSLADEDPIL